MNITTEEKMHLNYIDGEWVTGSVEQVDSSTNPANRHDVVGYVQHSEKEDLDRAVASAKKAQVSWNKLSGAARGEYLYKVANMLDQRLDEIAKTMTREMGKTFPEAKGETARGVAILRYYAGEGLRKVGDVLPSTDSEAFMYTTRAPLGVVGVITPWNFPVAIPIWKIAPALIYGNTVILKPARETAVTAAKVMECFAEAGLPRGVINMVTGSGSVIGQGIIDHPDINGITFTGSDAVGKQVGLGALKRGAKYQLEMGGKNPVIVANDA
ncbi:MAG TPA: aldehyde dehydrogenase family protein, partial [Niallia sp.]|nr:aldehyde dehydrogenase family protein [Niallia sp.]